MGRVMKSKLLKTTCPLPVAVFMAAILTTLLFWAVLPARFRVNESSDYTNAYEPAARNVLAGDGLTLHGEPYTLTPPGYPLLLAGVFALCHLLHVPESMGLSVLILLSVGIGAVFVFLLARTVWNSRGGLIASSVWTTYPCLLWLAKQPNSELPTLPLFYGAVYLFWRTLLNETRAWHVCFALGALVGVTMLFRPIFLGLGVCLGIILVLEYRHITVRSRALLATALLAGNLVAVAPWEVWLYAKSGKVAILSTGGGRIALSRGLDFGTAKTFGNGVVREELALPEDVAALMHDLRNRRHEMAGYSGVVSVLAEETRGRPLVMAKFLAIKAARCWYGTKTLRFETLLLPMQLVYLALILTGTWSAWKKGGVFRSLAICIWVLVFYTWAMAFMGATLVRYMVPAIGLSFVLVPGVFLRSRARGANQADRGRNRRSGVPDG